MSQITLGTAASPAVPNSFATDSGTATPAANVLTIVGGSTTDDNPNGIVVTGSGSTVTTSLTNRFHATASTIGAATGDIVTFDLGASDAAYLFRFLVVGRADSGASDSSTYVIEQGFYATGGVATARAVPAINEFEGVPAASVALVASGGDVILRVTGAAGYNISWSTVGEYIFV